MNKPTHKKYLSETNAQKHNYTRNTKKLFFSLCFLLSFAFSNAQTFSNLGFEYWQGNKFPLFWQHPGTTVSSDSVTKLSGKYSLKAIRQNTGTQEANSPYGLILQYAQTAFPNMDFQNKKFEVSVQIKSKFADTSGYANVFIQFIDPLNPGNSSISMGDQVKQQEGWTKSTTSITIGETTSASVIIMGVMMGGQGEMWLDDYQITCNGQPSEETSPRTTDLSDKEKKWLASNVIPITGETLTAEKTFAKKISRSQIIGIGDNVHGSASVVMLKNIFSKNLIEKEGFTIFAIEDSPCTGELLNQYVSGLSDYIPQDINVMYNNPGFMNMLSWIKEHNKSATKKVRIFGVDINARYERQLKTLAQAMSNKYTLPLDSIDAILKSTFQKWNYRSNDRIPFSEAQKQYITGNIERIKEEINRTNTDENQKTLLYYYANNLLHYLTFSRQEREKQMAGNIGWLLSQNPGEKMIYLAHNSHVGNNNHNFEGKRTGAWLKEQFKNKYYIIGTCYFDGTDSYKKSALGHSHPIINEAVRGSYENLFRQIKQDCFYLDLSKLTENSYNKWLFQPMLMRNYGVEPFNYYHEFSITNLYPEYDGVVFIKSSIPL